MTAFAALGCGSDDADPAGSPEQQRVRAVVRHELTREQLPSNLVNCIIRGARRELTSGPIGRKLAQDPTNLGRPARATGEQLGARLATACVRKLGLTQA
jgi:hypothetical protein